MSLFWLKDPGDGGTSIIQGERGTTADSQSRNPRDLSSIASTNQSKLKVRHGYKFSKAPL